MNNYTQKLSKKSKNKGYKITRNLNIYPNNVQELMDNNNSNLKQTELC